MIDPSLAAPVGALLRAAGMGGEFTAELLTGGGNNRVYRIDAAGRQAALKVYFHHVADSRDRLGAEFGFSRFAWSVAEGASPEPLAIDVEHRLGLYEFVAGRRLAANEVDSNAVGQATDFFAALNRMRGAAGHLGTGSEACFTVAEHLATVDRRIARHRAVPLTTDEDAAAQDFVVTQLEPAWQGVRTQVANAAGASVDVPLAQDLRCVSPSDFGFHNAILGDDGRLRFIDFEYAGWDDPAKLIGDFFNQVEVPVPLVHLPFFIAAVAATLGDEGGQIVRRARWLLPLYAVKWCCIILNEFHAADRERRRFATVFDRDRKATQIAKARAALARLAPLAALCEECS